MECRRPAGLDQGGWSDLVEVTSQLRAVVRVGSSWGSGVDSSGSCMGPPLLGGTVTRTSMGMYVRTYE